MKQFRRLLANVLVASVTANFLWFAVTFWAYLETQSVLATSIIGGSFMLLSSFFGLVFGSFVDRNRKKRVLMVANVLSLVGFALATTLFLVVPREAMLTLSGVPFWGFVLLVLFGAVVGNLRTLTIATCVTLLVPEQMRDRANGMVGTVNGIAFALTSVFSGLVVGQLGMEWALWITLALTAVASVDLLFVEIKESDPFKAGTRISVIDVRGAVRAIRATSGLFALILFTTFNNFLGGVFMSLVDPYGLSLVSVEAWGLIWGILSFGFVVGGIIVARRGLGRSPVRVLFVANAAVWLICILFPISASIYPLIAGFLIYMTLVPVIEAAEQTVIQRVVPYETQGRVFGLAQAIETAASPVTAFLIGPIAQFWVIPFMTTGVGARSIGSWFGTGPDRGMALVFMVAGAVGLVVTLVAMRSRAAGRLDARYLEPDTLPSSTPDTIAG